MIIDKFHCYLLVISVAFQIACNSSNQSSSNIASKVSTDKVTAPISRSLSEQDPLENNYLDHAVLMVHSEPLKVGKADILRYLSEHPMKIDSAFMLYSTPATGDSSIIYEISGFRTTDQHQYRRLIIWNTKTGSRKKELEYIAPSQAYSTIDPLIDVQRQAWMKLCNQHQVNQLVSQLYAPRAIYYNHKPIIQGTEDIIREYQYMNSPGYHLTLTPLFTLRVNDAEVFEIGQGSGSYAGKYILIWQKTTDGPWKVILDSNI